MNTTSTSEIQPAAEAAKTPAVSGKNALLARWGKRAGIFAFMFFFIKGLAWLVVPVALATWWAK